MFTAAWAFIVSAASAVSASATGLWATITGSTVVTSIAANAAAAKAVIVAHPIFTAVTTTIGSGFGYVAAFFGHTTVVTETVIAPATVTFGTKTLFTIPSIAIPAFVITAKGLFFAWVGIILFYMLCKGVSHLWKNRKELIENFKDACKAGKEAMQKEKARQEASYEV